jgi:hypothetical protein
MTTVSTLLKEVPLALHNRSVIRQIIYLLLAFASLVWLLFLFAR